jgi:hypothetical protein
VSWTLFDTPTKLFLISLTNPCLHSLWFCWRCSLLPIRRFRLSIGLWVIGRRDPMFNSQLGQALFEILPGEVSSSIAYLDSRCTETRKNHALDHGNGLLRRIFTTWHGLHPLGYIINHE